MIHYQLDNYKKPFSYKYGFEKAFKISQTLFDKVIVQLDDVIKIEDLDYHGVKNPPGPFYNCFATPPKIKGRIIIDQLQDQEKKHYHFDLEREEAMAEIERIKDAFLLLK